MEFIKTLENLVGEWGPVQIYPTENLTYEVRLPKYDETPNLMAGKGETLKDALLNLAGEMAENESKVLEDFLAKSETEKSAQANLEVKAEAKQPVEGFLLASPGGGKNHIFGKDGESLCGRATLPEGYDGEVVAVGDRPLDTETDCKVCVDEYNGQTSEEKAG